MKNKSETSLEAGQAADPTESSPAEVILALAEAVSGLGAAMADAEVASKTGWPSAPHPNPLPASGAREEEEQDHSPRFILDSEGELFVESGDTVIRITRAERQKLLAFLKAAAFYDQLHAAAVADQLEAQS